MTSPLHAASQLVTALSPLSASSLISTTARHVIPLEPIAHGLLGQSELAGRPALVPAGPFQRLLHQATLEIPDEISQGATALEANLGSTDLQISRQRIGREDMPRRQGHDALDVVLQLAHVARPVALHDGRQELGAQLGDFALLLLSEVTGEVLSERRYVRLAIAQRWNLDR